jgi:DNA polymerase-3 subunit alpha
LEVILRKGFASYFMVLWDIFQFTEKENIMSSTGRGSVCGSLVAYTLGISTIDPIRFGLMFERFLSNARVFDSTFNWFGEE